MDIVEKITALIKKAESAQEIGSLAEAQAFMAKAQELIQKYNVDKRKLGAQSEMLYAFSEDIPLTPGAPQWERQLLAWICQTNFCASIRKKKFIKGRWKITAVQIVGDHQNVQCCVFLYNFIRIQLVSLSRKYWKGQSSTYLPKSRQKVLRYFLNGAVSGIGKRLSEYETEQSNALCVYETERIGQWLTQDHKVGVARNDRIRSDKNHAGAGEAAAKEVSFNSPIESKAPERKLIN